MEISEFMQAMRAGPGEVALTTGQALARHQAAAGREEPAVTLAEAAEESAVRLLSAGYSPGALSALAQQLADAGARLETERAKIGAGERARAKAMHLHATGQIGAFDVMRMTDGDFGDPGEVERLERKMTSLQSQMAQVSAVTRRAAAGPEDPAEAATRRAHEAFREATRALMSGAGTGRAPERDRRPFASVSRGAAVSAEVCPDCSAAGATAAEHVKLCGSGAAAR